MRFEKSRIVPSSPKVVYDFLIDPRTWTQYWNGLVEVIDLEEARWVAPGDEVRLIYRLLGRRVEPVIRLIENRPADYVQFAVHVPGIVDLTQEWTYEAVGEDETRLRIVCDTGEPTTLWGKVVDRSVFPTALRRDLDATLSHIADVFAFGVPYID